MSAKPLIVPSFAKINLFLTVGDRREDGFHEICTVFQTISLSDVISFAPADRLSLTCSEPGLDTGSSNLIMKAADALQKHAGVSSGARIKLDKRIPFPGGLGGGSSNAAVSLLGLSVLWDVRPTFEDLLNIAAELGSDVPFFLYGGTVLGTGRGTDLEALADIGHLPLAIVTPRAAYSTAEAYKSLGRERLTSVSTETNLMVCRELAEKLISDHTQVFNDFEKAVATLAPDTANASVRLRNKGANAVCLSGSGPSVFGIFENESERQAAVESISSDRSCGALAADTLTRGEYLKALGPCGRLLPRDLT